MPTIRKGESYYNDVLLVDNVITTFNYYNNIIHPSIRKQY